MKIFFDGGFRPATGMELAVVAGGRGHIERELGPGSSMAAEWLALIAAIRLALTLELTDMLPRSLRRLDPHSTSARPRALAVRQEDAKSRGHRLGEAA